MTRQRYTGEAFDELVVSWLDDRAHGPAADEVLDRALARTSRTRPLPAWLVPERWLPGPLTLRLRQGSRLVPVLLLVGLLLLAVAIALFTIGSQRRLPPPFGLAAPGSVAFISDGHIWTANRDGSGLLEVTFDPTDRRVPDVLPRRHADCVQALADPELEGELDGVGRRGGRRRRRRNPSCSTVTSTARAR